MGQLIREDNRDKGYSYVYTYDNAGNITSKKRYAFTTGTLGTVQQTYSYTYNDSTWKDLLTSYNGTNITYDTIGNPTAIGSKELTWQGRELQSYFDGDYITTTYSYNADGIRTRKEIYNENYDETETHEYILSGSQVIRETVYLDEIEQYTLVYLYDELGAPIGIKYRTPSYAENVYDCYFFEKNLQGDIVAIYNASGVKIVTYVYDAWGNVTTKITSGTSSKDRNIANINPFRYRGYYYDTETGFYYVSSRYYDPEIGRWINADNRISGVGGDVLGYNMFAYCMNNPVNMSDPSGGWPKWLETAVKVASVVVAVTAVVVMVTTVSAVSAGTAAPGALLGASVFLGAALSGINGGVANEAKGNSYINGYLGGATGGAIQAACSKTPAGTIVGGGAGVTVGTAVTDVMNNLDPDSANSTAKEIASNAIISGGKALVTSSLTAYMGYASDLAAINGANGLMPTYTRGFGEAVKAFFGWLDDALVYIWE